MDFMVDKDVKAVAEFMQGESGIAANRLVSVAKGLAEIAPVLWRGYQPESIDILRLVEHPPIADQKPSKQSASNE